MIHIYLCDSLLLIDTVVKILESKRRTFFWHGAWEHQEKKIPSIRLDGPLYAEAINK
jgi:hypothetical protein